MTVHNVGSVTPGPGTACVDGQPTCDGEDTFTATPETAPLTITKSQDPDHARAGWSDHLHGGGHQHQRLHDRPRHFHRSGPGPDRRRRGLDDRDHRPGHHSHARQREHRLPHGGVAWSSPRAASVTFTITAHVAATYDGTQVTNTATATPGLNTACADGNPTCQAEVSFANPARLEVAKTHSPTDPDPVPGQPVTYTVTVTNPGTSATGSGTFSDPLPDPPLDAAGATWTCTATGTGSTCGRHRHRHRDRPTACRSRWPPTAAR